MADVPEKRWMRHGPKLWTHEHEDLLRRMRMEGARVSQGMAEAQREATLTHEKHMATWQKLHETKEKLAACKDALRKCRDELAATQAVLNDMDAAYENSQHHRMSRIAAIDKDKGGDTAPPERSNTPDLVPTSLHFAELDVVPSR